MSDLIERLRAGCIDRSDCQAQEAADEIERLQKRLRYEEPELNLPKGYDRINVLEGQLDACFAAWEKQNADIERLSDALREIRDVARCSEDVEFYAMLAEKALRDE